MLRLSGDVNCVVGKSPAEELAVEEGDGINPGTVKVWPEIADPSTIVPLAFKSTLQTLIEPVTGEGLLAACTVMLTPATAELCVHEL